MANSYFDFKKFRVEQSDCANKISTDACVFGAWLARLVQGGYVLDIGTGTGLLALMLAQAKALHIEGLEIEACCAKQAKANIERSDYNSKVKITCEDARHFESTVSYDYIISNPPFFNNSFQNTDSKKTQARQTETLGADDWEVILHRHANARTVVAILLSNNDILEEYKKVFAKLGFQLQTMEMLDKVNAACKRVILFAGKQALKIKIPSSFVYKDVKGNYTSEMKDLLSPFYLNL